MIDNIFYNTKILTTKRKKEIILFAKDLCYDWHVDKLDCSISWSRKEIDMSFEDILKTLNKKSHFTIVHRAKIANILANGEIAFSNIGGIRYSLYLFLTIENLNKLVDKYKLQIKSIN